MNWRIFSGIFLGILLLTPIVHAQELNQNSDLAIDAETGLNQLQQPFSSFLNDVSRINVSGSSSSQKFDLPDPEKAKDYWNNANDWLKEKTGLDILSLLKVIGNILVFIINLAIQAMGVVVNIIQWLVSLIPSVGSEVIEQ